MVSFSLVLCVWDRGVSWSLLASVLLCTLIYNIVCLAWYFLFHLLFCCLCVLLCALTYTWGTEYLVHLCRRGVLKSSPLRCLLSHWKQLEGSGGRFADWKTMSRGLCFVSAFLP